MATPEAPDGRNKGARELVPELSISAPDTNSVRHLSRSPQPYRRRNPRLVSPHSSSNDNDHADPNHLVPPWRRTPGPSSDSGTEADDEGPVLLKGLPAPQSSTYSRLLMREYDGPSPSRPPRSRASRKGSSETTDTDSAHGGRDALARKRKRLEVLRRLLETVSVLSVGCTVLLQREARTVARIWETGMPYNIPLFFECYLTWKLMCRAHHLLHPRHRPLRFISSSNIPPCLPSIRLVEGCLLPFLSRLRSCATDISRATTGPHRHVSGPQLPPSTSPESNTGTVFLAFSCGSVLLPAQRRQRCPLGDYYCSYTDI
jgi:hypothetical protein